MKNYFATLILLLGFLGIANADKAPVKFGVISKADLLNNVYASDTSAPAVILCDYGYYTENKYQTVRILRIKILKKEGYSWANQTFSNGARSDIKGITYNLENNQIVETKLKKESIFETRVTEDYYQTRVAMPNVRVGSIIDIQFLFSGIPYEWDFQQEIPIVHSELVIEPSSYVYFSKNFFGYVPLTSATNDHWTSDNVPAFKPEPYMTSSKNYRTRLEFDISEISFPGFYKSVASSWDAIRDLLFENTYFGIVLKTDGYMKSAAKDIQAKSASKDEMIRMAYDYIKQIKWDKTERLYTEKTSLNSSFKEGKGNSAEVNLALVQLLRRLDFDASPAVMSTRSNGRLSIAKPSLNKLNYVIAAVFTDKDTLLLDATELNCPFNLLPMRALNGQARFMDKNRTCWVEINPKKKDKQMVVYNLSIGDDLSLNGKLIYLKGDYAALNFRNDYEDFNSDEEYITDFKDGKKGLKVISHKIENLDSLYMPITEEYELVISNSVSDIDGELYINPLLYEQIKENPFKMNERKYPIDYGYAREKTILINFTIPEGYKVSNMPVVTNLKLPGDIGSFICKSAIYEGKISISYTLKINRSLILQTEYADLREFYNQIVAKEAEPIVLKKI